MRERELVTLLSLSSWCLVIIVWILLAVPWVCLRFVIVAFPDHTHLLFSAAIANRLIDFRQHFHEKLKRFYLREIYRRKYSINI